MNEITCSGLFKGRPFTLRSSFVEATPEIAAQWLTKNTRNRNQSPNRIADLRADMQDGEWAPIHQGIAFYEDGVLADGQTRLTAQVNAGETVTWLVTRGLPLEAGSVIDGGRIRSANQSLSMIEETCWINQNHVAMAKLMHVIERNPGKHQMSVPKLRNYCLQHRAALEFGDSLFRNKKKYLTTALSCASVACAFYSEDQDRLRQFAELLISGVGADHQDRAVMLLRDWMQANGHGMSTGSKRLETVRRIMRAIQAFCEREPIRLLRAPNHFIYRPASGDAV